MWNPRKGSTSLTGTVHRTQRVREHIPSVTTASRGRGRLCEAVPFSHLAYFNPSSELSYRNEPHSVIGSRLSTQYLPFRDESTSSRAVRSLARSMSHWLTSAMMSRVIDS